VVENDLQVLGALLARLVCERACLIRHQAHRLDDAAALALGAVVVIVDEPQQHCEVRSRTAGAQLQLPELRAQRRMQLRPLSRMRIRPDERRGLAWRRLLGLGERPHGPVV
jgi:hypothetical protein